LLRNIQEVLAEGEFRVGDFYHRKGSFPAAANRLQTLTDHFPLYSQSDEALWELGDAYSKMGARFRDKAGAAYAKIVKDYPLSPRVEEAKEVLAQMELPIPEPDPVAVARMKYEQENSTTRGFMQKSTGFMRHGPDTSKAAKSGTPATAAMRPSIPASVPVAAQGAGAGVTDVSVSTVQGTSDLDTKPDARQNQPQQGQPTPQGPSSPQGQPAPQGQQAPAAGTTPDTQAPAAPAATAPANEPPPTNHPAPPPKAKKQKKEKQKK
jgi:outer membrane protein assembly factor BamD